MLIRNHRSSTTTVTVAGTDLGTNEQVVEATRTIPGEEAATVPDPTDVEDSSGGGAFIEVGTQDGLRATYQWGGGGTDVQQLRIHVHSDAITFDIGPAELPDSNDSN